MKKLLSIFYILLFTFASVSCSGNCTYCRFPPGATIEYSYPDENGVTVSGQSTANDGGCIAAPCNSDSNSFEIAVGVNQV
jgi:hypothetical protein